MFVVRQEQCVECGTTFTISLEEFIQKVDNGMKLPKRCKDCRRKNREHPNPYHGIRSTMYQYTHQRKDTARKYMAVPFNFERRSE